MKQVERPTACQTGVSVANFVPALIARLSKSDLLSGGVCTEHERYLRLNRLPGDCQLRVRLATKRAATPGSRVLRFRLVGSTPNDSDHLDGSSFEAGCVNAVAKGSSNARMMIEALLEYFIGSSLW